MTKRCWACCGSGAVINWQGAPIECPICEPNGPFSGFTKKQYKNYWARKRADDALAAADGGEG